MWENNHSEYKIVLNSVFGENVPEDFKNTPTFCEKDDITDVLNFTVLNEEGQKVTLFLIFLFMILIEELKKNLMDFQRNLPLS